MPLHVRVTRGEELVSRRDVSLFVSNGRIVTLGQRAWLVMRELERETIFELGGDSEQSHGWPTGFDEAQICF